MHGGFMIKHTAFRLRGRLKLFTALTVAGSIGAAAVALAQTATEPVVVPGNGTSDDLSTYQIQQVHIKYKKLLLKEKDIPNAITHITLKQIQAENPTMGSIQTLLKQTPSVVAYNQGPGQSAPTLAIRGVRESELSETLDGIPITDLLQGSGNYLSNNVGSPIVLSQLSGVTVYPGVAPPDNQGFGTVGGTIAYQSKQATDERYGELEGGFGSFDTQHIGFNLSSGKLWDSPDAARMLLMYDQSQTAGFVSATRMQYHDMLFNINKPYDDGLSNIGLTVIYNQGKGYIQTQPTPTPLVQQKFTYNFPLSQGYDRQTGNFLTAIAHDETFINQYLIFDAALFYLRTTTLSESYANPATLISNYNNTYPYLPQVQSPWTFYGPIGPSAVNFDNGFRYSPGYFTYDPLIFNKGADPTQDTSYAAGESYENTNSVTNEVGFAPKLNILLHDNTIVVGALVAKESSGGSQYVWGAPNMPEINGYNSLAFGGGSQRTIYMAYAQDKIDLLNDKLHILPGLRATGVYTSIINQVYAGGIYNPYKLQNYGHTGDPYLGISYDLPLHFTAYGSYGKAEVFAPTTLYEEGAGGVTNSPGPESVRLYEAGIRYDTPRLYANFDYFYQKVTSAFGFGADFGNNTITNLGNPGAYLLRGVEAATQFQATPDLQFFANGSYNSARYLQSYAAFDTIQEDQFGLAFRGGNFSNIPDWLANFGFEEDHGPFSLRATGQYTGREYTTYDIADPSNPLENGATVTNENILNPANVVFNALLTYKMPVHYGSLQSLDFALNFQNIFDEHYYEYTYNQYLPQDGAQYLRPGEPAVSAALIGPPRSITFDVTAKF
jgi:iron complex outermembrane receptor protein